MNLTKRERARAVKALCAAADALEAPLKGPELLVVQPAKLALLDAVEAILEVELLVDTCLRDVPQLVVALREDPARSGLNEAQLENAATAAWLDGFHPVVRSVLEHAVSVRRFGERIAAELGR